MTPTVWLILVYLWWFIATPDNRFPEFGDIYFERILVALIVLAIVVNRPPPRSVATMSILLLFMFGWMLLSYSLSPYKDEKQSTWWIENYWKLLLFYFFVLNSIRTVRDLYVLLAGTAFVGILYQLHSWYDFINGGSYVWQQGVSRMVGVWSGGGIGAANNFGFLALFTIPFVMFWLDIEQRPRLRNALLMALFMCFASVFFSGTRGALLVSVFLGVIYGKRIFGIKGLAFVAVLVSVLIAFMPEGLRHRYIDQLFVTETTGLETAEEQIAAESAQGRIQGFKDGWNLALRRPVIGYGPGASPNAKRELPFYQMPTTADEEETQHTQLHNLYGQILSETGFVGGALFVLIVLIYLGQLREVLRIVCDKDEEARTLLAAQRMLWTGMLVLIIYGMVTHNFYRYVWLLLFAAQAALVLLARDHASRQQAVMSSA